MWKPLLKAKLGDAYKETAASFIWAYIQRMYSARRSGMKKEMFGYVRGGYARVLERFGEVLLEKGVEIRLNSRVESIERLESGKIRVTTKAARRHRDVKPSVVGKRPNMPHFRRQRSWHPVSPELFFRNRSRFQSRRQRSCRFSARADDRRILTR